MIYIVHGEDISRSRDLIVNQQKKLGVENKVEIDLSEISPIDFQSLISQNNLFQKEDIIVVDISNLGRSNPDDFIGLLKNYTGTNIIIILSDKSLPSTNRFIKESGGLKAKVIESVVPPKGNVFTFADSVFLKRRKEAYLEMSKLVKDESDLFKAFSILSYTLRNIFYSKFDAPLFNKLKPFQKSKIQKLANLYDKDTLRELSMIFYDTDKKVKTGELTPELMLTRVTEKVLNS